MIVTANERRQKLGLFNISEASRLLDLEVHLMHRMIKRSELSPPTVKIGKRLYYSLADLKLLKKQAADVE